MRIGLNTQIHGEYDNVIPLVVVDIDPKIRLAVRKQLAKTLAMEGLFSVTFFDYTPDGVSNTELANYAWYKEQEGADLVDVPEDFQPVDRRSIDCSTIRYMKDGIAWHFYEKHCDISYETATIPWTMIEEAAAKEAK